MVNYIYKEIVKANPNNYGRYCKYIVIEETTLSTNLFQYFLKTYLFTIINLIIIVVYGLQFYFKLVNSLISLFINPIYLINDFIVYFLLLLLIPMLIKLNHQHQLLNNKQLIITFTIIEIINLYYFSLVIITPTLLKEYFVTGSTLGAILACITLKSYSFFVCTNFEIQVTNCLKTDKHLKTTFFFKSFIKSFKNKFHCSNFKYCIEFLKFLISPSLIYEQYFVVVHTLAENEEVGEIIDGGGGYNGSKIFQILKDQTIYIIITMHFICMEFVYPIIIKEGVSMGTFHKLAIQSEILTELFYYVVFTSIPTLFANLTDYKDRTDISAASSFLSLDSASNRLNKWAMPVSAWIKKHVYHEIELYTKNKLVTMFSTIIISSFAHDFFIMLTWKTFIPTPTICLLFAVLLLIFESKFNSLLTSKCYIYLGRLSCIPMHFFLTTITFNYVYFKYH